MSFSLSAPPPPITPSPRRQRGALLVASALIHIAVLVPVALNTVFLPKFEDEDSFEVWIDMPRDTPRPTPKPQERREQPPVVEETDVPLEPTPEETKVDPVREQLIEKIVAANPQITQEQLSAILPQIVEQKPQVSERLEMTQGAQVSDLNNSTLPGLAAPVTRPVIEAIDGPTANTQIAPLDSSALPSLQSAEREGQASQSDMGSPDTPIPRRARIDDEAEAALAAAARGGALDDAWTYRPEAGGAPGSQGGQRTDPMSGQGGLAGNTATQTGRIYYGQGATPVDCTQPQMLSDIQRLSCDSADQRRIRQAIERGVRVQGSGNGARDAQLGAVGAARMENYEALRRPASGGTGNPILDTTGSGRGAELDAMSGTDREVSKLQQQIGASNGPRPPPRGND